MDELQERKANESDSESSSCNDDEGSSEKEETAEQKSRKCIEIRSSYSSTQERLRSKRKQLPGTSANPDNLKIQKLTLKQPVSTNNSLTGHFRNCSEFVKELVKLNSSHTLHLNKCTIESLGDKIVPLTKKFKRIIFNNCNENVFKLFTNQNAIKGIEVYCDQFDGCSLKISKLVIDKINSDWFIGLKSARLKSLKDQNGSLKSLTIQQLPYDFDGGKVLKYIIEDMNLETFTYGNLCLIYNREKRQLIEFVASESQITSAVEMIRQFPSIRKFTLEILNSDISSENVESILKQDANLFNIIEEFVVIDRTKGTLGIFLDLFKSLIKLKKLVIWSNNRFINNIFKNLPVMKNLRELNLNTTAPPAQRYKSIKTFAPNLRILKVNSTWYTAANESFGNSNSKISIEKLDDENDPENSNVQRSSDNDGGESSRNERGAGNDDGDKKDDEKSDKSATPNTLQKYQRIVPKTLDFLFDSSFTDRNINDARKLYIHVCGHAKIILTDDNIEELEQLTQEEAFWEFVIAMFTEEGKIIIEFGSGADDSPHQFKAKMADLAYQLNEKIQLPLLPLLNNPQIIIKTTLINMTWDAFLTAVNRWNKNLSSQRWKEITNFSGNSLIFQADAESYYKIEGMGNKIYIGEKAFVEIAVDENERNVYEQDARAVSKYVVC